MTEFHYFGILKKIFLTVFKRILCKCQNFCLFITCISSETTGGSHVQYKCILSQSCFVEFWFGLALVIVFQNHETKLRLCEWQWSGQISQNYCRTHWPAQGMPAMWRIVVLTYFQLCVNTCVIGIGSTKSTKTPMYPEFR